MLGALLFSLATQGMKNGYPEVVWDNRDAVTTCSSPACVTLGKRSSINQSTLVRHLLYGGMLGSNESAKTDTPELQSRFQTVLAEPGFLTGNS